jgi:hypothetical protein
MNYEFYPTPFSLTQQMIAKFETKNYKRILEPSAGRGDLLKTLINGRYETKIDCIEIDLDNQAILREKNFNVIGMDFLQFENSGYMYSHIIMNPPFSNGIDHVLKGFDLLFDGELVAILNAETILNPCSEKKKHLVSLINEYGSVEFVESAFTSPDTLRKTEVKIAIVHLVKRANLNESFSCIYNDLKKEKPGDQTINYQVHKDIAIKESSIVYLVKAFNNAVESHKKSCITTEEALYFSSLLGAENYGNDYRGSNNIITSLHERYNTGYDQLKKSAWQKVLNSTEFNRHLSSKAYKALNGDFDQVARLEFTLHNIRSFLMGLIDKSKQYNLEMVFDTFDSITKYHSGNRAYYKGWKSNDKHKTQAFRVKMTRFVLPVNSYWEGNISHDAQRMLQDFDKTFAMLDGKQKPETSLEWVIDKKMQNLLTGERMSSCYFDIRYYPGVGTLHFFPRKDKKDVIDRLNRLVGKERKWLPNEEKAGKTFWKQYDLAEKVTSKMNVTKLSRFAIDSDQEKIEELHAKACDDLGIDSSLLTAIAA